VSVCSYPINFKMAELIRPNFCVGPHMTQGKIHEFSKFQKFVFKSSFLVKFLKWAKKYYEIRKLFLYCTKRRCSHITPQSKVEIENILILVLKNFHWAVKRSFFYSTSWQKIFLLQICATWWCKTFKLIDLTEFIVWNVAMETPQPEISHHGLIKLI